MAILINMSKGHNIFRHNDLSFKAKGLYLQLARYRTGKYFLLDKIIKSVKDNRTSVFSGLKELEDAGLFYRFPIRKQRISSYIYLLLAEKDKNLDVKKYGPLKAEDLIPTVLLDNIYKNNKKTSSINSNKKVSNGNFFEADELLNFWQNNFIKHHLGGKTYDSGKRLLVKKLKALNKKRLVLKTRVKGKQRHSYGYMKIKSAMLVYKKLLDSDEVNFPNKPPFKASLVEFFHFSSFMKQSYPSKLKGIGSWYSECSKGKEYCFKKYSRFNVIERMLMREYPTKDADLVMKVAERWVEFHESVKNKLNLPNSNDGEYATRFLKILWKFIERRFKGRKFKLYIILNKKFLDIEFVEFLKDMDWMK